MKVFLNTWGNRAIAITSDLIMIPIAWVGAFFLYFNLKFNPTAFDSFIFLILIQSISCFYCGLYRGIWRFASIPDLIRILQAVIMCTAIVFIFLKITKKAVPGSIFFIYALLLICLFSGSRILYRWLRDYRQLIINGQRVLVVGAGNAGEGIVRDILRLPQKTYRPVAFVDDDITRRGREIHGIRVAGTMQDIPQLVKKLGIELIIIAIPSASSLEMRRIVTICEQTNVPFHTLPGVHDLAKGKVNIKALREVLLQDLLGREQAVLDWDKIREAIERKTILVSGGGGSIGSELCRQIASQNPSRLIIVENNEYNLYLIELFLRERFPHLTLECFLCTITDKVGIENIFYKCKPDVVFHAAAFKHVPLLQFQLRAAIFNNIIGTQIMAEAAVRSGVNVFVLISSDKAVNPTNIMGATKRASEVLCQNMNFQCKTKFITVRFGNVLDSKGSVIPLFRKQLRQGGPLTVTHPEVTRFFMSIPEATQLILQAATMGEGGEIYILDMGEPIKISYLAEQMIRLSGKIPGEDIKIQYTGLRPGEKLNEELIHKEEEWQTTCHAKIMQATVRRREWETIMRIMHALEEECYRYDENRLMQLLLQLVPEYEIARDEVCLKKSLSYV